jgi:hypothetical protein
LLPFNGHWSASIPFLSAQAEHSPIRSLVCARFGEILKRSFGSLNHVMRDKRRAFRRALLAALDAAFPLQHGPAGKIILRQLGKNSGEIDLPIA